MQENNRPDSFLEESSEEIGFQETQEIGDEIFARYEKESTEAASETLSPENVEEVQIHKNETAEEDSSALEAGNAVIREILKDEANFDNALSNASPTELVMLLETIAKETEIRNLLPKVPLVRKAFEKIQLDHPESIANGLAIRYNTALARLNRKRAEYFNKLEKDKGENTRLKKELLEKLKVIVGAEKVTAIQEVREIQLKWKEIGWVSQDQKELINDTYKHFLDLFYSQRGKYNELKDLDRKHNLEEKLRLIAEIELLYATESDLSPDAWNSTSLKLKDLKDTWRTIGPVPKENAEEINEKLKNTLDSFYSLRQEYNHAQDSIKEESAALKMAILEKLKVYDSFVAEKAKEWNHATDEVVKLQEEWKKVGPAPWDKNRELWKEYRRICDGFFERKSGYFHKFDEERNENLVLKTKICEQAEAAMNSTKFRETAELLRKLQNDWKNTGPVHERISNKIWKRFRTACDLFFKRRQESLIHGKEEHGSNLAAKEEMIARLSAILEDPKIQENVEEVKEMQVRWRTIGHVPFEDKERVNLEFKEKADSFFNKLHERSGSRNANGNAGENRGVPRNKPRPEKQGAEIKDTDKTASKIKFEISKVREKLGASKEKVEAYETNIQMISKGKSGDGLRKMIQQQIDEEKIAVVRYTEEIKKLNSSLNPPQPKKIEVPLADSQAPELNGSAEKNMNEGEKPVVDISVAEIPPPDPQPINDLPVEENPGEPPIAGN